MMDCTAPSSSATQCLLQLDKEQMDPWKSSQLTRLQNHSGEHSLSRVGQRCQDSRLEPLECRDLLVQNALFSGDLEMVQKYFTKSAAVNLVIEAKGGELRWTSRKLGLWSLSYEQELTTPLHITAGRGYTDCLRLLLLRGAAVNFAPGGKTALHEACAAARTDCVRLLLSSGADPAPVIGAGEESLSLSHLVPHRCVQQLLQHGASVNSRTEEEGDTALHVAARHGLTDHGQLRFCQLGVEGGASINAADRDCQHPLHLACKNANAQVAELLLARGANVNVMNYSGNMALHNVLQATAYKLEHHPELIVQALLNYGAVRIWPGSLLKVLRYCHTCPRVIEALMNSYDRVRVSQDWVEAVPAEVVQKYPRFYQSLFALEQRPRSLQHLARCTLRTFLEGRLLLVLPQLHLPSALHRFLLLGFEDVLY
ncbi:ASB10 protein, partial [Chloroceryle aenea]|nr:ASB10 protein [Chloroceryle aenea]